MIAEIIFAIFFTLAFFLHEKYRITEDNTAEPSLKLKLKVLWHRYKGFVQITVFGYIFYICFKRHLNWFYAGGVSLFVASFFWFFHDGLLNTFLFKKEWWYEGSTAQTDKTFGALIISIAKVICLLASITMIILWKTL
jgi:hypothetical protein